MLLVDSCIILDSHIKAIMKFLSNVRHEIFTVMKIQVTEPGRP